MSKLHFLNYLKPSSELYTVGHSNSQSITIFPYSKRNPLQPEIKAGGAVLFANKSLYGAFYIWAGWFHLSGRNATLTPISR